MGKLLRIGGLLLPVVLVGGWLVFAGSYSRSRDLLIIGAVTVASVALARRRRGTRMPTAASTTTPSWSTIGYMFVWAFSSWVLASAADFVFREAAVPLKGTVVAPPNLRPSLATLRVGVALSGGGYRAALVHAGVLQELGVLGIPVTNISSVSGGSIIASFVASGGDPQDFVQAVKDGRFRLKRELLSAFSFPRWISPWGTFSRRDVQAGLVRNVLLGANHPAGPKPELMLATTDLLHGLSVGVTREGVMMSGPTTERFFRFGDAIEINSLEHVEDIAAVSGAFPGAFPALNIDARLTVAPEPLATSSDVRRMPLALVDGGVRDNLGLRLLTGLDHEARGNGNNSLPWTGFRPSSTWALDFLIVSDGGQSFSIAADHPGIIAQVSRAIELSGLETGILRPVIQSAQLPAVFLSTAAEIGLSPDATIVQSTTRPQTATRRDYFLPRRPDDPALVRMVALLPRSDNAQQELSNYKRSRGASLMNLSDLDLRCQDTKNADLPECHWRALADLLLDDINSAADVFRRSPTLEDQYSAADADALVRLGRYFVLLKLDELEEKLATKSKATSASP